jgi:hypothetical protein
MVKKQNNILILIKTLKKQSTLKIKNHCENVPLWLSLQLSASALW